MKVKVISLPYFFLVLYVLCFTRPRYQVSVYRTIGPLVMIFLPKCRALYVVLEKGHGAREKGHGAREKGHGVAPC